MNNLVPKYHKTNRIIILSAVKPESIDDQPIIDIPFKAEIDITLINSFECNSISTNITDKRLKTFNFYRYKCHYTSKKLDLTSLPNYGKNDYQLDHKISIYFGFKHNIPYEIISSIDNLQYISKEHNANKSYCSYVDKFNQYIIEGISILDKFKPTILTEGFDPEINRYDRNFYRQK